MRWKLLGVLAILLCLPFPGKAQQTFTSGPITAASTDCSTAFSCVSLVVPNYIGTGTISLSGTWSATIQFQGSNDNTNWVALNCFPLNSTTAASSATANGTWTCNVAALTGFRARASAYVSGTANVTLNLSPASSAKSGGGGGGGTPGGSDTQCQYNNAGSFGGVSGCTTDGTTVTLVAPILGIPTSGTLTNATGLPISTGVSGLATGIATFLGTPSSANLATAVTNETGSGLLVFATSPTFTTPILGTPTSGTLTNATGLPLSGLLSQATNTVVGNATSGSASPTALAMTSCSTAASAAIWTTNTGFGCNTSITAAAAPVSGLTGAGTGVLTFLATPSSANLASALTDETGTNKAVFSDSPTLVTPTLGAATATSITTSGSNGGFDGTEGTGASLTAAVSHDLLYPDSTSHCWHQSLNNVDKGCIPFAATSPVTLSAGGTIACATCGVTGSSLAQFASTTSAELAGVLSNETGTGVAVFGTTPTFTTSLITPALISTAGDPADAGVIRLGNNELIGWEKASTGTDWTLKVDASDVLASTAPIGVGTYPACTAGTSGAMCFIEGTAFTNVASTAGMYADSTAHELMAKTAGSSSAGMMVRAQPGQINQTAVNGNISTATLCAASAGACNIAGQYHVHWSFTGAGTACSDVTAGSVTFLLTWTDDNSTPTTHSAVAMQMMTQTGATTTAMQASFAFQTALANESASGDATISTNGSIIQYATTRTACTTGTGTYNLKVTVTRLQ